MTGCRPHCHLSDAMPLDANRRENPLGLPKKARYCGREQYDTPCGRSEALSPTGALRTGLQDHHTHCGGLDSVVRQRSSDWFKAWLNEH
jgi:hypothetical protein